MNTRSLLPLFVIGLLLSAPFTSRAEPLRIGLIAPLTGEAAAFGTAIRNGLQLATEEVGAESVQLLLEDDQFIPARTATAFHKFATVDNVDVVVTVGSTPSHAVAVLAEKSGVPLFAWASAAEVAKGRRYVVRTYASTAEEGGALAQEALRRGYQRVALFYSPDDYTIAMAAAVRSVLGNRVVFSEEQPAKASQFQTSITKALHAQVQEVLGCFTPGNIGLFAKQLRSLGFHGPFFGCESIFDEAERIAAAGTLDGAWAVRSSASKEFTAKYRARFGNENMVSAAAIHYDLVRALCSPLLRAKRKQDLIAGFLALGPQQGALPSWEPRKTTDDQFIEFQFEAHAVGSDGDISK